MVDGDVAFDLFQRHWMRRFLLAVHFHQLQETLEAGDAVLVLLGKIDQLLDRLDEHLDI